MALFDKFLNKHKNLTIEGVKLRDAILINIETYPLGDKDKKTYIKESTRFFEWSKKTTDKIIEYPKGIVPPENKRTKFERTLPGETGAFNIFGAKPCFDNTIIQIQTVPAQSRLIWVFKRNIETKGKDPIGWAMIGARRSVPIQLIYGETRPDLTYDIPPIFRMDYYQDHDDTVDWAETYIKQLTGEPTSYHSEEKVIYMMDLQLVLKVFAIINCKNVFMVKSKHSDKIQKKRRKKNKLPLVSYYTIKIGDSKNYNPAKPNQDLWDNRLHICRGHFKHYTKEKPLFGRIVGTYWWQPCIRGKKKKGLIVKDYTLPDRPA